MICYEGEETQPLVKLPCCRKWIHQSCLDLVLKYSSLCPHCRAELGSIIDMKKKQETNLDCERLIETKYKRFIESCNEKGEEDCSKYVPKSVWLVFIYTSSSTNTYFLTFDEFTACKNTKSYEIATISQIQSSLHWLFKHTSPILQSWLETYFDCFVSFIPYSNHSQKSIFLEQLFLLWFKLDGLSYIKKVVVKGYRFSDNGMDEIIMSIVQSKKPFSKGFQLLLNKQGKDYLEKRVENVQTESFDHICKLVLPYCSLQECKHLKEIMLKHPFFKKYVKLVDIMIQIKEKK